MKNTPLCIYDKDTVYLERLSRFLMGHHESPFLIRTYCGDTLEFLNDIKEGFLVISSSLLREEIKQLKSSRVIILAEGEISTEYEDFLCFDKFQTAGRLYEFLIEQCADRRDVMQENNGRTRAQLYSVYSPVGRIGKSQFAVKFCREQRDKKVLLMNIEEFSKTEDKGEGLSELIYYYRAGKKNINCELQRLSVHEEGYERILPAACLTDLTEMTAEDMRNMITQVIDCGLYDIVVIDINMLLWGVQLLDMCKTIFLPYIEDTAELRRVYRFEQMLNLFPEYNIQEKIKKIKMILPDRAGGL